MKKLMLKSKNNLFLFFIISIAITLISRKTATILILISLIFSVIYFFIDNKSKKSIYDKNYIYIAIISIPFLLEVIFFFNNDDLIDGYKSLEKNLTTLFFPLIIVSNYKLLKPKKILNLYSIFTVVLLVFFLVLFIVFRNDYFNKYLQGIHLWQMGYEFSNFIGIHAPALNMYVSFISIFLLYNFLNEYSLYSFSKKSFYWIILFLFSFFFLLIINTRIALLTLIINLIVLFFIFKMKVKMKLIIFSCSVFILTFFSILFVKKFPFIIEKYSTQITGNLDKIGKLDEIENPEINVYSSLVTRLSIWESSYELGKEKFLFGHGSSDAKKELIKYYGDTNQKFLKKYELITHNQILNYFLKFGAIGVVFCLIYLLYPLFIYYKSKNIIALFFFINFFISNITDDYLNKFDGLAYSALWYSILTYYVINKRSYGEN
jgi:hypothetical protein